MGLQVAVLVELELVSEQIGVREVTNGHKDA